ncbi:MAG: conjugal transfer protein TrbL family protein [Erysipelotrichaceae bacterium]
MNIIDDSLRSIFWWIASALLKLTDTIYNLLESVATFSFMNNADLKIYYNNIMIFLGLFFIFRVSSKIIKIMIDDEARMGFDITNLIKKLFIVAAVYILMFSGTKLFSNMSVEINKFPSVILTNNTDSKFSNQLVNGFNNGKEKIENWEDESFDINETERNEKGTKVYKYYRGIWNLLYLFVFGVIVSYLIIIIAVDIGKRCFELVMLLFISPLTISSIINDGDDTFKTWIKNIAALPIINFMQIFLINLAVVLLSTVAANKNDFFLYILLLISSLLIIQNGASSISRFIGADIGSGNTMSQVTQMAGIGMGAAHMVASRGKDGKLHMGAAIKPVANAIGGAGYLAGRVLGGNSARSIVKNGADSTQQGSWMERRRQDQLSGSKFKRVNGAIVTSMYNKAVNTRASSNFYNNRKTIGAVLNGRENIDFRDRSRDGKGI